ncbi:MAG: hypothetical protein CM1200mP24_02960 [Gammaproteobacteria bacterium]|nr:MAG: hypothetical protein CM1200mP24_02960 [Gammaproteobacteria bacterium]
MNLNEFETRPVRGYKIIYPKKSLADPTVSPVAIKAVPKFPIINAGLMPVTSVDSQCPVGLKNMVVLD